MKPLINKLTVPATVIIILFFVKLLTPGIYDPDFYWHLKTGEYIVSNLSIPNFDPFSYTAAEKTWVAHEWLSDVIFYLVVYAFGFTGIKILIAFLFCTTFSVLLGFAKRIVKNDIQALLISIAFLAPLMPYSTPRPQTFTFLIFAFLLVTLLDFKYFGDTKKLFAIPFIMPLWVNLHGAYVVGFVLLMIFLATETVSHFLAANKDGIYLKKLYRLALTIFLSALTVNLNPHFIEAWTYPFYLMSLEVSKGIIVEWRSPDFHLTFYKYYLILIAGYFLALSYSRKKLDLTELAVPVFFTYCGIVSQRHLPLTAVALLTSFSLLHPHLTLPKYWVQKFGSKRKVSKAMTAQLGGTIVAVLNVFLIAIVAAISSYAEVNEKNEAVMNKILPVKATDYIIDNNITGNMLNDYTYGGYLIYRLSPERKVFIDGRADMYGDAFVHDYMTIYNGGAEWKEKFNKFSIDYIICNRDAAIRQLVIAEKSFKEVYADDFHSVLVRKDNENKNTPETVLQKVIKPYQ